MTSIFALLKTAGMRMNANSLLRSLHAVALVIAPLALLLMLVDRLPAESFVPWVWVGPAFIVVTCLIAMLIWMKHRATTMEVAVAVDESLDLREKLSTAIQVRNSSEPFARAAVEDAVQAASDPRNRERLKRAMKVQAPAGWWMSPTIVLVAMLLWWLPQFDAFAQEEVESPEIENVRLEVNESLTEMVRQIEAEPELSKELTDMLGDLTTQGTDQDALRSPEDVRRDAVKKVYELNKRLQDILNGEKGRTNEALDKALSQLDTPAEGPSKDFADALKKGDFSGAKEALEKLLDQVKNGDLTEEQMEQAAEQLEALGEQLENLAQQQQQLEQALQQAGLDPQLAQNPQALQQAIRDNPNLNQQQKQQLQQMAQAQQAAQQMCQGLGGACQGLAQAMQQGQGGQGQMGQAGQQAMNQLSDMEQLQQLLKQAQAAANACQGQCQGLGQGLAMKQGTGGAFGGRGQGAGGKAPLAPTPTGTRIVKADVETTEGDIIARTLVEGEPFIGESTLKVSEVAAELVEGYDEAISEEQLPRKYHEAHKHFFGELEKQVRDAERKAAEKDTGGDKSTESGKDD